MLRGFSWQVIYWKKNASIRLGPHIFCFWSIIVKCFFLKRLCYDASSFWICSVIQKTKVHVTQGAMVDWWIVLLNTHSKLVDSWEKKTIHTLEQIVELANSTRAKLWRRLPISVSYRLMKIKSQPILSKTVLLQVSILYYICSSYQLGAQMFSESDIISPWMQLLSMRFSCRLMSEECHAHTSAQSDWITACCWLGTVKLAMLPSGWRRNHIGL